MGLCQGPRTEDGTRYRIRNRPIPLKPRPSAGKGFPGSNIGFHFPSRAAAARPRRRGEPCEARAPRPAPPEAGPELCGKQGRAVPPLGGATSPAPPLLRGRGETRQRRAGFPPAPQPPPRSLERGHVAARPAPPSPPRTHGAGAVGPASSCLADSRPARSRPAGPRSLWEPPPALAWPGRGRSAPASLPDPVAVLAAAKGPGGLPRSPGEAVLDVGPGPCTSLCRGEEACKIANSSRSWKMQLWQSLPGRRLR
ncbi:atherin-like [Sagmatias obliquidens]|uniref:atherin-like n=1 Tax=Sagmatias obliquidens TaxID=3371155 RepID=UPI000F444231|nr:atherin-like [Lagenorhynchus obliquidens]